MGQRSKQMQTDIHFVWRGSLNYHLAGLLDTIDALYTKV